jgi:hypothetical protein
MNSGVLKLQALLSKIFRILFKFSCYDKEIKLPNMLFIYVITISNIVFGKTIGSGYTGVTV